MIQYYSNIEVLASAFIEQESRKTLGVKKLQRLKALINKKLDNQCCGDSPTEVDLFTVQSGPFLGQLEVLLNSMPTSGKGAIASLNRLNTLIDIKLGSCCE